MDTVTAKEYFIIAAPLRNLKIKWSKVKRRRNNIGNSAGYV